MQKKKQINEVISTQGTLGASQTKDLKKEFRLFHRFIAYNVILQKGHYNQVTTIDNFIIYRSAIEAPLNLNYIILKEMANVRNHKNRALPFDALLTKIFTHFRVKFSNQYNQFIDEGFSKHMIKRGISIDTSEEEEQEEEGEEESCH